MPDDAAVLAGALAAAERETDDALTHGFHAYPARMHPAIARAVLAAWASAGMRVLDPFCGSGTVLLEARRIEAVATGVDLNPVALRVAEVRLDRRTPAAIDRFVATARAVTAASIQRVKARAHSRAPISAADRDAWAPHVLRELGGLWAEIEAVEHRDDRRALEVVLSAIVVKFSRRRADTSSDRVEPRVGKLVPSRFFERKATELAQRWSALAAEIPAEAPAATLVAGDARELPTLVRAHAPFALVLTSPPYGGTYDYVQHHALRYPWLGESPAALARGEIGARRRFGSRQGVARWDQEVASLLRSIAAVVRADARIVLLVGDAQIGDRRIDALTQLRTLAPAHGLTVTAWASQPRPDFHRDPSRAAKAHRAEHLVVLRATRSGQPIGG